MKKLSISVVGLLLFLTVGMSWEVGAFSEEDLKKLKATEICEGCDLSEANLGRIPISICVRCNLSGANLAFANLRGAVLTEANLSGAFFWRLSVSVPQHYVPPSTATGLYGAILTWADLTEANLYRQNLRSASLDKANLTGANLTEADLDTATLERADLTGANLTGANLTNANLERADLTGANLTGTIFCRTTMPDGTENDSDCGKKIIFD